MDKMDEIQVKHSKLSSCVSIPNASSKLSNFRSIHSFGSMMSLSQLDKFMTEALKVKKQKDCYNIGCLKGQIMTSINLQPNTINNTNAVINANATTPSTIAGKRKCHNYENDSKGRAREAVDAARHRLKKNKSIHVDEAHLDVAEEVIRDMFSNIQGVNGELVFESLGLSVSPTKMFQQSTPSVPSATPCFSTRPQLIIACRISGGVAIQLFTLARTLSRDSELFDGMITTDASSLGPEYRLPMSDLGKVAEKNGQQSMLLFVSVPIPKHNPKPTTTTFTTSNTASADHNDDNNDSDRPFKKRRV
jgi:hypothetical protein